MMCAESLRLQAYFDGELDPVSASDIERHVGHCAECSALLRDLDETRELLRREIGTLETPAALRARIAGALDEEWAARPNGAGRRPVWRLRSFWAGACSGLGAAGLAAGLAVLLMLPPRLDRIPDEILQAHLRSLLPAHLIEVESTDRHTVKPWFAGRSDVSPQVADFTAEGFPLAGGRVDIVDHQRAAVLVYRHGPHVINVFCWHVGEVRLPVDRDLNGYHFVFWKAGDLAYGAVSDTGIEELRSLEHLMRE